MFCKEVFCLCPGNGLPKPFLHVRGTPGVRYLSEEKLSIHKPDNHMNKRTRLDRTTHAWHSHTSSGVLIFFPKTSTKVAKVRSVPLLPKRPGANSNVPQSRLIGMMQRPLRKLCLPFREHRKLQKLDPSPSPLRWSRQRASPALSQNLFASTRNWGEFIHLISRYLWDDL